MYVMLSHRKDIGAAPPFYPRKDIYFRDLVLFSNDFLVDSHFTLGFFFVCTLFLSFSISFSLSFSLYVLLFPSFILLLVFSYTLLSFALLKITWIVYGLDKYTVSIMRLDDSYLTVCFCTIFYLSMLTVCNIFHLATFQNIYSIWYKAV